MAVGAFQRADEGALLGPALPFAVLDLVGVFVRWLVVPQSGRFVFEHAGHGRDPLKFLVVAAKNEMIFVDPVFRFSLLLEHDPFRKPVPTFRDHALARRLRDFARLRNVGSDGIYRTRANRY